MTNPVLTMLCQAVEPELMRLKAGQTKVVAMPPASLAGNVELEFALWCDQRGFTVTRERTTGGTVFTITKPLDQATKRDRGGLEAAWQKLGTEASPNLTILCQTVEMEMNRLKPGQTMGLPAPPDWTVEMEGPFRAWCQVMEYELIEVSRGHPSILSLRKGSSSNASILPSSAPLAHRRQEIPRDKKRSILSRLFGRDKA